MSNVAGKAYAMNVVTPMRPGFHSWLNRLIFMATRGIPSTLGGLLGLSIIHFARWVIIRREDWPQRGQPPQRLENDYMLFVSNFNGTWDQYIDAFSDALPGGLDTLWYSSTKYPHSIPITPFKNYIRANQVDTGYYYNATPGSAQRDIKAALRLAKALRGVDAHADEATLAAAYRRILLDNQNGLGAPGYAPVASCDTAAADLHRCGEVRERWGPQGRPPAAERVLHPIEAAVVRASAANADPEAQAAVRAVVADVIGGTARLGEVPPLPPLPGTDAAKESKRA